MHCTRSNVPMSRTSRQSAGVVLTSLGLLADLIACDRAGTDAPLDPPAATDPGASPVDPSIPRAEDLGDEAANMRYTCEGGWNVAIAGDVARVTASDGRVIELQRVADRSRPLFTGEALEFSVEGDGAALGQDEGGLLPCKDSG